MEENNLVYVFLNSKFTDSKDREVTHYAYDELPEYYTKTYNHNKQKFNSSHFITNNNDIKLLTEDSDFKTVDNIFNKKWERYKKNPFWYNTTVRVILLCLYVRNNNLKNVTHVEADNIIFADNVNILSNTFKEGEFGYSNEAPYSSAPSFIFIKDKDAADKLLRLHIKLFEKGEQLLAPYVGQYAGYLTDMAFLDLIYRSGSKHYRMLPCLPSGSNSHNFDSLQYVFDPTSYGQYLGGTNNGHPPGFKDSHHYVGHELLSKRIDVKFDKIPFIIHNNKQIPIFNLHVHNKKAIEGFLNA
jgi:hypothetical protein